MKEYKIKINGNDYNVTINGIQNSVADVTVNGINYSVEVESTGAGAGAAPARSAASGNAGAVATVATAAAPATQAAPAAASPAAAKAVKSPLPGVIIEVSVKEGDIVKRGQKVAVLEAMKMENDIPATQDGTVTKVCVSKGDSVLEGAEIVQIA